MNIENTVSCIADTAIYEYKFILKYIYLLIYKLTLIIEIRNYCVVCIADTTIYEYKFTSMWSIPVLCAL